MLPKWAPLKRKTAPGVISGDGVCGRILWIFNVLDSYPATDDQPSGGIHGKSREP
jgi:hypothetical protein